MGNLNELRSCMASGLGRRGLWIVGIVGGVFEDQRAGRRSRIRWRERRLEL